jgi:hypothetical protein
MTRTNRDIGELPQPGMIVEIPGTTAAGIWGVVLCAAAMCIGALVGGLITSSWLTSRIDAVAHQVRTLQTFQACTAPPKPGDSAVITIRNVNGLLATRCQLITDPLSPERAGRTP